MNKRKLFVLLSFLVFVLVSAGTSNAIVIWTDESGNKVSQDLSEETVTTKESENTKTKEPEVVTTPEAPSKADKCKPEYCDSCKESWSDEHCYCCSGGSSSSSSDEPKPVALPEDSRGAYYTDGGVKKYIQYKTWSECMNDLGDANRCGRLVTDECESCIGTCQTIGQKGDKLSRSCGEICKTQCGNRYVGGAAYVNPGQTNGGTDDYGTWYLEGGQKKYSGFNDFRGCWSVMGDAKECIKYGYYCGYKNGFYISYLCNWDDDACIDRVKAEYAAACN